MRAHVEDRPERPAGMPDPIWELVEACLAKEPRDRPTAHQIVAALATPMALDASPPPASPATASMTPDGTEVTQHLSLVPVTTALSVPATQPPPDTGEDGAVGGDLQPTMAGTRPPVPAPVEPAGKVRRRRWPMMTAVLVVAALGLTIGLWLSGVFEHRSASPGPLEQTSGQDAPPIYPVMISTSIDAGGQVVVSWSQEIEKQPGFQSYSVWRNDRPVAQVPAGVAHYADPLPGAGACYRVFALGVTLPPPVAPPAPQCP
jgi:hypothetical protein